ncbi:hypothetical protein C1646_765734 [Rhizophagus diaphanus]|nr:hypothetical protein C1646_765734 [Rhizophagus diaphanus] [Rhizophagus sp. MUCL 43196]
MSKQESAASSFSFSKTQKQTSIPESSEDNGPFRLVVPSSLSNIHRELTPITRTNEPYRSNIHRELTPITHTTEPYRSNVHTAEPYRRELMPIIREPYSSNWTRDRRKGKNLVRDSEDEMEVDEEEARKKAHRIKGTKSLFDKNDEKLENYDRKELLNILSDNRYYSPEYSELDEKQPDGAPNWTYIEQNMPADTDFSEPEMPIQTEENLIIVEDVEVSVEMDEIAVIEDSELTGMKESEPMRMEESPEMEDETDKCIIFVLFS